MDVPEGVVLSSASRVRLPEIITLLMLMFNRSFQLSAKASPYALSTEVVSPLRRVIM